MKTSPRPLLFSVLTTGISSPVILVRDFPRCTRDLEILYKNDDDIVEKFLHF